MNTYELSLLVAVHVMGWKQSPETRHWSSPDFPEEFVYHSDEIPMYAQDMNTAWQVVDKLEKEGYTVTLKSYNKSYYICVFEIGLEEYKAYCKKANYPETAICLAALQTRGIEL